MNFLLLMLLLAFAGTESLSPLYSTTQIDFIDRSDKRYPLAPEKLREPSLHEKKYIEKSLVTPDGTSFKLYHAHSGHKKLLIIGPGFQNNHSHVKKVAQLFHDNYDVLLFDYRWTEGLGSYISTSNNLKRPTAALLLDELLEIETVVRYARTLPYEKIIGLGQCYSAFLFVVAQAEAQEEGRLLFDKLILDSCFYSLDELLKSFLQDPFLAMDSKKGGFPSLLRKLVISNEAINVVATFFKLSGKDFPLAPYLKKIKSTPILFIHGTGDKLVTKRSFKKIWKAAPADKSHLSTPYHHIEHVNNHALYQFTCDAFIRCPSEKNHSDYLSSIAFRPYCKESIGVISRQSGNFFKRIVQSLGNSSGR